VLPYSCSFLVPFVQGVLEEERILATSNLSTNFLRRLLRHIPEILHILDFAKSPSIVRAWNSHLGLPRSRILAMDSSYARLGRERERESEPESPLVSWMLVASADGRAAARMWHPQPTRLSGMAGLSPRLLALHPIAQPTDSRPPPPNATALLGNSVASEKRSTSFCGT